MNDVNWTGKVATLSSAAAGTVTTSDFTNTHAWGMNLYINLTAVGSATSIVVTIQGKDPVGGSVYTILASASLTGTGLTVLRVFPMLTASSNLVANDIIPPTWNVKYVVTGSNGVSGTITAALMT